MFNVYYVNINHPFILNNLLLLTTVTSYLVLLFTFFIYKFIDLKYFETSTLFFNYLFITRIQE